ncbi:hypothetical protein M8818_001699 [Zalaria obscura]|uniref:Uncharacterized protein n=1 Tax=Zalaria obscura TaxID=2024903 RepID=A0ACC3SJ45_9PEZI
MESQQRRLRSDEPSENKLANDLKGLEVADFDAVQDQEYLDGAPEFSSRTEADSSTLQNPAQQGSRPPLLKEKSKLRSAFEEARHFAGGLIPHPSESTKHFSVLRHSHGLVYYKGPATNVAVTIFSSNSLPSDRRIWLQKKGWLGKSGWAARAVIRANGSWIDVTPEQETSASAVNQTDDRAWQRDINRFLKKAKGKVRSHAVRETNVIRIPCEAGDGYFRIVLCKGDSKRILCPSPTFRIASLGTSSASFKGSSLRTLPIELGVSVASSLATSQVNTYVSPITDAISNTVGQYLPSYASTVGTTAYDASGAADRVDSLNQQYDEALVAKYGQTIDGQELNDTTSLSVLDHDSPPPGPLHPFPFHLASRVVRGTGKGTEYGMPTANLRALPEDLKFRLLGVYFGWARVTTPREEKAEKEKEKEKKKDLLGGWKQSIITIAPDPHRGPQLAPERTAKCYIIRDLGTVDFCTAGAKVTLLIMGFLHSLPKSTVLPDPATFVEQAYEDVVQTQSLLGQPGWDAENTLEVMRNRKATVTERYVQARQIITHKLLSAVLTSCQEVKNIHLSLTSPNRVY